MARLNPRVPKRSGEASSACVDAGPTDLTVRRTSGEAIRHAYRNGGIAEARFDVVGISLDPIWSLISLFAINRRN
jgi:hypothetical protein